MQLQRSLFSFYKVFIRKTPLLIWIGLAVLIFAIIGWQVSEFYRKEPVYNFDNCIMQLFNATRGTKNQTKSQDKSQLNPQQKSNNTAQNKQQLPFYLQPKYYHILNETSIAKIYLSDSIPFTEGEPACRIVLNTQRIKFQKQKQKIQVKNNQKEQKQKVIKLLQKLSDSIKIDDNQNQNTNTQQQTGQKQKEKDQQSKQTTKRPDNVKDYNEISQEQQKFFLKQHPYMHLTANSHIIYLDQHNQFLQKHGVQTHAIILSKQQIQQYSDTIFGISSKFWRFHSNQQIQRNAITLKSLADSFYKVTAQIKEMYLKRIETINMIISLKKFLQSGDQAKKTVNNDTTQTSTTDQEVKKNLSIQTEQQKDTPSNQTQQPILNETKKAINILITVEESPSPDVVIQLPTHLIEPQQIYPLSQLKLYFHYPQTLRVQEVGKLVNVVYSSNGIFFKTFFAVFSYLHLFMISCIVGLVVRYAFFWIMTLYLFLGGCFINKQWGWVSNYFNLIRNRDYSQQNVSWVSSAKMLFFFTLALMGILTIFSLGSKYILQNLFIYTMTFSENYYSQMLLKNFFIIQLFYYVCCRSRVTLKYFPLLSIQISFLILFLNGKFYCYNITWLVNLHLLIHLLLMAVFAAVQNYIGHSQFHSDFTPSEQKPRAMYFIGYDISWENSLPPIWTYFTTQFDLKCFNEKQKALINRDYQLLYGRLLGMNERQQLPQDQQPSRQQEVHQLNQNLSESNEMSLIR